MDNENNLNVMYFHGKTIDGNTRFTIAGVIENDDLILGVSICSEQENFVKSIGRNIATGRVLSQRKNNTRGRSIHSLYAIENTYSTELGHVEGYFLGNEAKVFREECSKFEWMTKNELLIEFNLKH